MSGKVSRVLRVCPVLFAFLIHASIFELRADVPTGMPAIALKRVAAGFQEPVHVVPCPDACGRLVVVEQKGRIVLMDPGSEEKELLLDLRQQVEFGGEKGLLSIAFAPDFATNRKFYVNYTTNKKPLMTVVSEFSMEPGLHRADREKERILLSFRQSAGNHNGGCIAFGPDGYLYIGNGDGGSARDPENAGQRLDTLLGKMLRIDVNRSEGSMAYGIPPDNPFLNQSGVLPEIYAYGLRNPWRFSWDRVTGLLYAGDVGQNALEEVNVLLASGNYGWRVMEGDQRTPGIEDEIQGPYIPPIAVYGRDDGKSITGGYVYRGAAIPALQGVYLYADYVSGKLWGLRYDGKKSSEQSLLLNTRKNIASFGETADGEILVVDRKGDIFQIILRDAK